MYVIAIYQEKTFDVRRKVESFWKARGSGVAENHFRVGVYHLALVCDESLRFNPRVYSQGDLELILGAQVRDATGLASGAWIQTQLVSAKDFIAVTRDPAGLMAAFFVKLPNGYLISDSVPLLLQFEQVSRAVDINALNEYWFTDYCFPPRTVWRDIRAVPNGHRAELSLRAADAPRYAQLYVPGSRSAGVYEKRWPRSTFLRRQVLEVTEACLALHEQPPMNLLSAGVDSSVVFAACNILGRKPELAITFKSAGDSDESELAGRTAAHFGVPLHVATGDDADLIAAARRIAEVWGQPYGHSSVTSMMDLLCAVPTNAVLYTGDGGGEAFGHAYHRPATPARQLGRVLELFGRKIPFGAIESLYYAFAMRNDFGRKVFYWKELSSWQTAAELVARKSPITETESALVWRPEFLRYFSKHLIGERISHFAQMTRIEGESVFTTSLLFWWGPEGVYAKTWRLLDQIGALGFAPLTAPAFIEAVKSIPMAERGMRKQALRDAFAAELPKQIVEAPARGLSTFNRELLVNAHAEGIEWLKSGRNGEWGEWFNFEGVEAMWNAHAQRKVYRTNLLFKVIVFSAWMELWKPAAYD
ncbi:MAG: hypothetical protein N838_02555 [Thiohalocapsa sp. PB-PSB1]|jgi:hypothetical protein|nr:MAG: hypothetical protein N838_02555 [Thiohalocapsa sp. PB-PSB1]